MGNSKPVVVGLGEVLWDVFPDGARFGGAPANYACHAASLGADAYVASAVGRDELGDRALQALQDNNVDTRAVAKYEAPTGAVHVTLDDAGKAAYEFLADTAWDRLEWSNTLRDLAARTNAVCFGTLGQRSARSQETIRRFVEATPKDCLRIFDINLRPPFFTNHAILESIQLANVLKLNDDELPLVATLLDLSGNDQEMMQAIATEFSLQLVALTRGEHGALLLRESETSEHPGISTTVADTVGAGDSYTAALTLGLLANHSLDSINAHASRVAAYVCSQSGATPKLPADLIALPNSQAD